MDVTQSHPSWVCGLKLKICYQIPKRKKVTPFVGVWIETNSELNKPIVSVVTPFVGVWIETLYKRLEYWLSEVTPFVGVWIETNPHTR